MRAFALTILVSTLAPLPACETTTNTAAEIFTRNAELPQARVVDASIADIAASGLALTFDIEVTNPYPVPLPLGSARYALATRGEPFVSGDADLATTIPAMGTATVTVPAAVNFTALLDTFKSIRPGSIIPYKADLELAADLPDSVRSAAKTADGERAIFTLPISTEGELPIPAPPSIEVTSIAWDRLDLADAAAQINLRVTNPNVFDVNVQTLETAISIARRQVAETELPAGVSLAPGDAATLTLPISFSPINFGSALLGMLTGDAASYDIIGNVDIATPYGDLTMPFEQGGVTRLR